MPAAFFRSSVEAPQPSPADDRLARDTPVPRTPGVGLAYTGGAQPLPRPADIPRRSFFRLQSYDGLHCSYGEVFAPGTVEELRALFQLAKREGRRITFRSGGQSFDGQSLNDDIVISMVRFNRIEVDPTRARVTVGPGATWGAIVRELAPHGLVPYVVVSTSYATAGGTASGDCLSRFSGEAGKEGAYIEELELLTTAGELLALTPKGDNSALFRSVIGGLGYFGAILRLTYRVGRVGPNSAPIRVVSRVARRGSLEGLAESLVPAIRQDDPDEAASKGGEPAGERPPEALYSVAFRTLDGNKSIVVRSTYSTDPSLQLRRMLTHRPRHALRVPIEWLIRASVVSQGIWTFVDRFLFDYERPYVDELFDYTFFMDGNVLAKRIAQFLGMPMSTVQQAFMIPFDPRARGESLRRLVDFLKEIDEVTRRDDISPTLLDALHIKGDDFLLSANHGTDGIAVTLAFETSDEESVNRIRRRLTELSGRALSLGGRVYLVKNVHATAEQLEAMYAHALPEFVRLKQLVDPQGILRNEFLERVFPAHFPARRALSPP